MAKTSIEWTDETWNPVTGCTKVSEGCRNCYAERIASRFWGERKFDQVMCHAERLDAPLRWRKPRKVFVCSMGDLFHPQVPFGYIEEVFNVMVKASQHIFQVLTKRAVDMRTFVLHYQERKGIDLSLVDNIWLGVSCESQPEASTRIPVLINTPAAIHFISCEPLLGGIWLNETENDNNFGTGKAWIGNMDYPTLDWVIVGGESGPMARPTHPNWALSLRYQCKAHQVPFFFKNWGEWGIVGTNIDREGHVINRLYPVMSDGEWYLENGAIMRRIGMVKERRELDGRLWEEFPTLRVFKESCLSGQKVYVSYAYPSI